MSLVDTVFFTFYVSMSLLDTVFDIFPCLYLDEVDLDSPPFIRCVSPIAAGVVKVLPDDITAGFLSIAGCGVTRLVLETRYDSQVSQERDSDFNCHSPQGIGLCDGRINRDRDFYRPENTGVVEC